MKSEKYSFFSDLLQGLGIVSAISLAILQYTLNDSFTSFFYGNEKLYKASGVAALVLSLAIILGVFVFRYKLLNKIYLKNSKKVGYFEKLRLFQENQIKIQTNPDKKYKRLTFPKEPFNVTFLQLAFVFIILSTFSFILLTQAINEFLVALLYILFICLAVTSISIFSIQLYTGSEMKRLQKDSNEILFSQIRERFSEQIKVVYDSTDFNTAAGPNRQVIFEYLGKKYRVFSKASDPQNYFLLEDFQ